MWLLLTGEVPKGDVVEAMTQELHAREAIPASVDATINSLPKTMHPMTQLSIALLALQPGSMYADAYAKGTMTKGQYWDYVLEDALTLAAQIPIVAAKIYRRTFKDDTMPASRHDFDWAGNYAHLLGVTEDP